MPLISISLCDYDVVICGPSVGDPVFRSVEKIVISMIDGGCFLRGCVAPCLWLTEAKCTKRLSCRQWPEILFFLSL